MQAVKPFAASEQCFALLHQGCRVLEFCFICKPFDKT